MMARTWHHHHKGNSLPSAQGPTFRAVCGPTKAWPAGVHEGATDGGNLPPASTPLLKPDGTTPAQSAPTVPPPAGATVAKSTSLLQKVSSPPSALGTAVLAACDPTTPSNAGADNARRISPRKNTLPTHMWITQHQFSIESHPRIGSKAAKQPLFSTRASSTRHPEPSPHQNQQ